MNRFPIIFLLATIVCMNVAFAESECLFSKNMKAPPSQKNSSFENDPFIFCFGDFNAQINNSAFRVDEYCDLNNVKTQCREKFKDFLKKNGCSYERQPVVCDLESQIKKLGHVPEKFTCAYASPNCYTVQNSRSYLCASGFASTSIPGNNDIKLCTNRRDNQGIEPEPKGGVR